MAVVALCNATQAQSGFKYTARLQQANQSGFYHIELLPEVTAKLQPTFNDLRVVDATGKQVPYMLQAQASFQVREASIQLPVISNRKEADNQTHVVAKNTLNSSVNNLLLSLKNADATRTITISGSDDLRQWYVIRENLTSNKWYADTADTFSRLLTFTKSNYKFFKIIIQGKELLPLNIVGVSIPVSELPETPGYVRISSPSISQKDSSDGYSYVTLRFDDSHLINRLSVDVSGAKFFKRNLYIIDKNEIYNEHAPYSLSSNEPSVYDISFKTNNILLKIQNNDNHALKLTHADAYQIKRFLITWLEKGDGYKLVFGDSLIPAPLYDIAFFKDSIKVQPTVLSHGNIEKNNVGTQHLGKQETSGKIWIWISIGAVLLVLLFSTFRMMKEISKNQ